MLHLHRIMVVGPGKKDEYNWKNNQVPSNNNQKMTNNQIQITKQKSTKEFDCWLLNIGICLEIARLTEQGEAGILFVGI